MNRTKIKSANLWSIIAGILLITTSMVLLVWFMARGETAIDNGTAEVYRSKTLTCKIDNYRYPFFTHDESIEKSLEVDFIFGEKDIQAVALKYILKYKNADDVRQSEAKNHAAMNISFSNDKINTDALSTSYSKQNDKLITTLYADNSNLDKKTKKYFLINDESDAKMPIDFYEKNYTTKGFKCEKTE